MILVKQLAEPGIPRPLPPGTADEVDQAGLSCVYPVFVYPVALTALTFPFYDLSLYSCDIPFSTP
jgi:hypothetical protein